MSLASVRAYLAARAPDLRVIETEASSATVELASVALGIEPGRIAKTLAVRAGDRIILVVMRGDARLDNSKARAALGAKPRMLAADETLAVTGHPVGGVCPFGLPKPLPVYCDISLRDFATVFPAAGALNASVEIPPERMAQITGAIWIDACKFKTDSGAADSPDA